MIHPVLAQDAGPHLLLGNEAIVRGALEAGINYVTCYPGTPSSEVPDTFRAIASCGRFAMEYSANEKVALEVGGGAALAGAMTLTTMKHVGVNVAADPLMTMTTLGLPGGLVLLSADDPGCHSSQNEQDNRTYARFAQMPCFEPATAQEAKDMAKDALLLARQTGQPVMLRTTTRVNHLRGPVTYGPLPASPAPIVPFTKNPRRFVPVPAVSRQQHRELVKNLEAIRETAENSAWNREHGKGRIGVIASGISRAYLHDAIAAEGWQDEFRILELGFTWPLPVKRIEAFLRSVDKVLILEESEPLLERDILALARRQGIGTEIFGKGGPLTVFTEYTMPMVREALAAVLGKKDTGSFSCATPPQNLPQRPPTLCAGCAHRAVYYAVRRTFGDDAIYSSDIGCYTLGLVPPLSAADFLFCMGSSISAGSGFARFSENPVIAFIGDSTFFHSGMTGLVNAVFNRHNVIMVILDNGTTAMTGHQPNPGVDQNVLGDGCVHLDIESIVRGIGVEHVRKIKPYNVKATLAAFEEAKAMTGVRVIIAEEPCVLYARRTLKKKRNQTAYVAVQGDGAQKVAETLACPSFFRQGGDVAVDEGLCAGCMVCMQISPDFKARKKEVQ
ncbi:Indolepyruvate oxidoreductase subunit IorA [uncultured delta proteobacterium]|uniref:Indolepyruvate oxidoreductase subunit IorA n=1 Tax=uncultured delta proteobacterium TaxID=34034 RepID=A0A212ITJ6_9DELT|nr:Indolepyruvate oxidoreductase subunit IorA [uncultured delta proteobacterium]